MMDTVLSCRTVLRSGTVGVAMALRPTSGASAGVPFINAPAISSYRYKVGSFEITAVYDGHFPLRPRALSPINQ